MNRFLIILIFSFLFADNNTIKTIQLYSSKKLDYAIYNYKKLPNNLKKECFVFKIKKYFTLRCYYKNNLNQYKKFFKDAYINHTYKWRFKHILYPKTKMHNFNISLAIYKANLFFKNQDYLKALNEYKKIYKYNKNKQVLINIAYIYGIVNQKKEFINFLKNKSNKEILIYAFSLGEIKYNNLSKKFLLRNLKYSKKGYLNILLGFLYEKENKIKLALNQYKKAFNKNPYNKYFIYLYARGLDLNKKYKKALIYYKKIMNCDDLICKYSKERVNEIK